MTVSGERYLILISALLLIVALAAVGFQIFSEYTFKSEAARMNRAANLARQGQEGRASAISDKLDSAAETPTNVSGTKEKAAAFAALFSRVAALLGDSRWKQSDCGAFLGKPAKERSPEDFANAKTLVSAVREIILELRRLAALDGPALDLDYSKGANIHLPPVAPILNSVRLLAMDAIVQSREGNTAEAVEDLVAALRLGEAVQGEPILFLQILRFAAGGAVYTGAEQSLPPGGLDSELAMRLIEAAQQAGAHQSLADSFAGEAADAADDFDRLAIESSTGAPSLAGAGSKPTSSSWSDGILTTVYGSRVGRPLRNLDGAEFMASLARVYDAAKLPYAEARPLLRQLERDLDGLSRARRFTRSQIPGMARAFDLQARYEAQMRILEVGLAIEVYRARNESYPSTLEAAAPILGGAVPADPFTGAPLIYRPSGRGFLLYSVGENLVDDRGQPAYRDDGSLDFRHGDIVWRGQPGIESEK